MCNVDFVNQYLVINNKLACCLQIDCITFVNQNSMV